MPGFKSTYISYSKEHYLPIQFQPWWLDAVCGNDNWNAAVVQKGNNIIAVMPYYIKQSLFGKIMCHPPFTAYMGPWVANRVLKHKDYEALLTQLPKVHSRTFQCHFLTKLPMTPHWHGYNGTTRYTYIIHDAIWRETTNRNSRRNLIKGQSEYNVKQSNDPSGLIEIMKEVYHRRSVQKPFETNTFKKLFNANQEFGDHELFYAVDSEENPIAGIYFVKDEKICTCLLSGVRKNIDEGGALLILFEKAIESAMNDGLIFDFEGSMIQSVEPVFRGLGATQQPYSRYTYQPKWRNFVNSLKQ